MLRPAAPHPYSTTPRSDLARVNNGYLGVPMREAGLPAHVVLGHARAQTTKELSTPEPNVSQTLRWEKVERQLNP